LKTLGWGIIFQRYRAEIRHFVAVSIDYEIVLRLSLDRNNIVEPYFCPASSALG